MKKQINIALRLLLIFTLITGVIYPLLISGISNVFFHDKAHGSLVEKDGKIAGSSLIGQANDSAAYFWPRPSAVKYQTLPSGASNYGWSDKRLQEQVKERKQSFIKGNMLSDTIIVPAEMLFASASGIDPDISQQAALLQSDRVSKARNFNTAEKEELIRLIAKMTEKRQYSIFGEERINVFLLNLNLDKIK